MMLFPFMAGCGFFPRGMLGADATVCVVLETSAERNHLKKTDSIVDAVVDIQYEYRRQHLRYPFDMVIKTSVVNIDVVEVQENSTL